MASVNSKIEAVILVRALQALNSKLARQPDVVRRCLGHFAILVLHSRRHLAGAGSRGSASRLAAQLVPPPLSGRVAGPVPLHGGFEDVLVVFAVCDAHHPSETTLLEEG